MPGVYGKLNKDGKVEEPFVNGQVDVITLDPL
jgi:hypothetical protein